VPGFCCVQSAYAAVPVMGFSLVDPVCAYEAMEKRKVRTAKDKFLKDDLISIWVYRSSEQLRCTERGMQFSTSAF
jgi:hypothetical protein